MVLVSCLPVLAKKGRMDSQEFYILIRKYNEGNCSPEEKTLLEQWFLSFEWNKEIEAGNDQQLAQFKERIWQELASRINTGGPAVGGTVKEMPVHKAKADWWRVAAAILVLLAAGGALFYFTTQKKQPGATKETAIYTDEINPGTDKAQLTLADGSIVSLDGVDNTRLKEKDGTSIDKNGGNLSYKNDGTAANEILYNTLTTPRGGQYGLVLPDGSKVWLNAVSSLRFPTRFSGSEREVYLTGEAYFEVAKNTAKPFLVKTGSSTIQVLGTHFNINAYNDEASVNTTLLEGMVKVSNSNTDLLLAPGQQAQVFASGEIKKIKEADTEQAIAWKNGYFQFDQVSLPVLMRQIARWYDIDIAYEGNVKEYEFVGKITRSARLPALLKALELSGVHFKMNGKKLIVIQ